MVTIVRMFMVCILSYGQNTCIRADIIHSFLRSEFFLRTLQPPTPNSLSVSLFIRDSVRGPTARQDILRMQAYAIRAYRR